MSTLRPVAINNDKNNNNKICDIIKIKETELEHRLEQECRTCTRAIPNSEKSYQLKEAIAGDRKINNQTQISYGDFLQQLMNLQLSSNDWVEALMPQIICKQCATLLRDVYRFITEAQQVHQNYLHRSTIIKVEDCLAEAPIDLPLNSLGSDDITETLIKLEPPQLPELTGISLEIIESNGAKVLQLEKDCECNIFRQNQKNESNRKLDQFGDYIELESNISLLKSNGVKKAQSRHCTPVETNDKECSATAGISGINSVGYTDNQKLWAVRCEICHKIYRNAAALATHKKYTHIPDEKKIPCPLCSYRTCRISNLKTHLQAMHGSDSVTQYIKPRRPKRVASFGCQHCSRCYCRKDDLQRHIKKKHGHCSQLISSTTLNVIAEKTKRKPVDRFLCMFCGQTFESKKGLCQHARRHTGERPYKCDLCSKAFMRQQDMKLHRLIHSDEKPHQCTVCGKTFKRKDKLTTHKRVHSELRPYKCTECDKTFKYSTVLRTHMHIHTGEKPFQCKSCGECFSLRTSLNIHCRKSNHMK